MKAPTQSSQQSDSFALIAWLAAGSKQTADDRRRRRVRWVAVGGPMTQLHAGESANWRTQQKMQHKNRRDHNHAHTHWRIQQQVCMVGVWLVVVAAVAGVRTERQIQTQSEAKNEAADTKANREAAQQCTAMRSDATAVEHCVATVLVVRAVGQWAAHKRTHTHRHAPL